MSRRPPDDHDRSRNTTGENSDRGPATASRPQPAASKHRIRVRATLRDRGERRCLLKALSRVASGSTILDIPCGTGALTSLLVAQGFRVTGADVSENMIQQACTNWDAVRKEFPKRARTVSFEIRDVMQTGYEDGQFDAVLCHRLLHQLGESQARVAVLTELRRIARNVVLVSYLDSFAVATLAKRLVYRVRGSSPQDRAPIPAKAFRRDLKEAGLIVRGMHSKRWGISQFRYVVAQPDASQSGTEIEGTSSGNSSRKAA